MKLDGFAGTMEGGVNLVAHVNRFEFGPLSGSSPALHSLLIYRALCTTRVVLSSQLVLHLDYFAEKMAF